MNSRIKSVAIVLFLYYLGVLPLIYSNYNEGRAFSDQKLYHYPVIVHFSEGGWVADYSCTSTPGYHLLLAIVNKWGTSSEVVLKLVSSIFTAFLFVIFAIILGRAFSPIKTAILCFPAITSIYILPSGIWLIPDNLSWLTIALMLFFTLKTSINYRPFWLLGLLLAVSVFVKQVNMWLILPLCVSLGIDSFDQLLQGTRFKVLYYFRILLVILPALLILLIFYIIWGGFVPPSFQSLYQSTNTAAPPFFFASFFSIAIFYLPFIPVPIKKIIKNKSSLYTILLALLYGLIIAIIPETDWSPKDGRVSGLWNLIKITPVFENRSILLSVMSSLGSGLLIAWLLLLKIKTRWIMTSGIIGFIMAHTLIHFVYERYYSGFIFIVVFLSLYEISRTFRVSNSIWQFFAPSILAIINLAILVRGLQ